MCLQQQPATVVSLTFHFFLPPLSWHWYFFPFFDIAKIYCEPFDFDGSSISSEYLINWYHMIALEAVYNLLRGFCFYCLMRCRILAINKKNGLLYELWKCQWHCIVFKTLRKMSSLNEKKTTWMKVWHDIEKRNKIK